MDGHDLRSNKIFNRPVRFTGGGLVGEHPPPIEDDDDKKIDERAPCGIGLERRSPWLVFVSDTLREASGAEPEEGDQDRHPSEERGDGCELKSEF